MRITKALAIAIGAAALAACNQNPQEEAAENIEENAEMTAENIVENAENAAENIEENAENAAENITENTVNNNAY